jgi:hypothetical protein
VVSIPDGEYVSIEENLPPILRRQNRPVGVPDLAALVLKRLHANPNQLGYTGLIWTDAADGEKYNPNVHNVPQCPGKTFHFDGECKANIIKGSQAF